MKKILNKIKAKIRWRKFLKVYRQLGSQFDKTSENVNAFCNALEHWLEAVRKT